MEVDNKHINDINLPNVCDLTININKTDKDNENEFILDNILIKIGQFGKYQLMIFALISIPMMFNAIFSVTYVFTASSIVYRCNITECDTVGSQFNENWTTFAIPYKGNFPDKCSRFSPIVNNTESSTCDASYFNQSQVQTCPNEFYIFRDKEKTISNEFNIYCSDEWKLALVGTINNLGQFFGIPFGGLISDKYGRRISLALGAFLAGIVGIIRSVSPSYMFFMVFEFFDNFCCGTLYSTCFIMGLELVGPKRRVIACSIITVFYAIGEILLAVVAKYTQNWRILLRVLYIPALLVISYIWILPESVRWLLTQGEEEKATKILKNAAQFNKRKLSDGTLEKLVLSNRIKLNSDNNGKFPIKTAFSLLFWRIANCSLCWIVNVLVYYGISLNAVLLDGNKYNNFMFIALVEIPGFLLPYLVIDRFGRRFSLCSLMLLSGISCLATAFIPIDQKEILLALFLLGKLAITASFQVLYFFTSEIFPTNLRNSLISFCSMMGRFGSMAAPLTPLLTNYDSNAPAYLFASTAILSGLCSMFFPETKNVILPATLKDAEVIGIEKEKK